MEQHEIERVNRLLRDARQLHNKYARLDGYEARADYYAGKMAAFTQVLVSREKAAPKLTPSRVARQIVRGIVREMGALLGEFIRGIRG